MIKDSYDAELERLSDKVRRGEPIGLLQVIAVFDYQERRQAEKEQSRWREFMGTIRRWHRAAKGVR